MTVHGLLLAAGEGRRFGGPKALVPGWLADALAVLGSGGADGLTVVVGAAAEQARTLVPDGVAVVVAEDWAEGMGASLRAGLSALAAGSPADAALVHLVDLPDVGPAVAERIAAGATSASLRRASYAGRPGHPVLIGRDHWAGVIASARGDHGARDYLRTHAHEDVACDDLATGEDVDTDPR